MVAVCTKAKCLPKPALFQTVHIQRFTSPSSHIFGCLVFFFLCHTAVCQQTQKVNKEFGRGDFINDVRIILVEDTTTTDATPEEMADFYNAFFIKPGTTFNPLIADLAMSRIAIEPNVERVYYELYEATTGSGTINRPLSIQIYVILKKERQTDLSAKGILASRNIADLPTLYESKRSQFMVFANGGIGLYNEVNALFGQGASFAETNPIADNPSGEETRFWLESYVEPGLSGITELGRSNIYWYGEVSALASGRNTDDIYSSGSTIFLDVERLYSGFLAAGLGQKKNMVINANYGRNFFQLNDGFLFSKLSGSSNAGQRGSVYSSSRKAFEKNGNVSLQWGKYRFSGHFLEQQELLKDRQLNTNYAIATFNFNNNKNVDAGISYISTTGGKAQYATPDGTFAKKGMYTINPKLWLTNIGGSGLFFKTEMAWQSHSSQDMNAYAWYSGIGYNLTSVKTTPSIYYRYATMTGDDADTDTYERFDPMLTGGLGNWVQGLNFRKVLGNGNIVSHRVEITSWISPSISVSLDYFYLRANTLNNLGGLTPISKLENEELGHEASLTVKGLLQGHYTLLGILSYSLPGKGLDDAFDTMLPYWFTAQLAVFINF